MHLQTTLAAEFERVRSSLLKAFAIAHSEADIEIIGEALDNSMFPLTFFMRNIAALEAEARWQQMPSQGRKSALLKMLHQRCLIFGEVKHWLRLQGNLQPSAEDLASAQEPHKISDYCTHCGGCCEIASGLADFDEKTAIPCAWQELFGMGLGPNHRFCAFLWELNSEGRSVCAIHEWRPRPCRLFAEEECRYLMKDRALAAPLDQSRLVETCRSLCVLMDEDLA